MRFSSWASEAVLQRDVAFGGCQHLLGLAQIGARRDAALQPRPGQRDAAPRIVGCLASDLQQVLVGGIAGPGQRKVGGEPDPYRSGSGLGRQGALAFGGGGVGQPAEQVDFEARYPAAERIAVIAVGRDRCRRAGAHFGQLPGADGAHLRARGGKIGGGDAQVAVVDQRLLDQRLQARIAEDLAVGHDRQRCLALREIGVADRPATPATGGAGRT